MAMLKEAAGIPYLPKGMEIGVFDTVNYRYYGNREFTPEDKQVLLSEFGQALQNMFDYQDERDGIIPMSKIKEMAKQC